MKKKLITIAVITGFLFSVFVTQGHAGSRDRHLVKGILIGTGAVILGAAIANGIHGDDRDSRDDREYAPRRHYRYSNDYSRHARFERVWVEPIYEMRWNRGHYNRRGYWVNGTRERVVVRDGFWKNSRGRGRH